MRIAELIKELQKYEQNLPVHLAYEQCTGGEVIRIFQEDDIYNKPIIYLSEDEEE